jgi:hypothetical protein
VQEWTAGIANREVDHANAWGRCRTVAVTDEHTPNGAVDDVHPQPVMGGVLVIAGRTQDWLHMQGRRQSGILPVQVTANDERRHGQSVALLPKRRICF